MAEKSSDTSLSGHFCSSCGQFMREDELTCPSCATPREMVVGDEFSLSVNLSVWICDKCRNVMTIGTRQCKRCGSTEVGDAEADLKKGPINRAKVGALGDLRDQILIATQIDESGGTRSTLSDDQIIAFINRNQLISDSVIIDLREIVGRIDISSVDSIRSQSTRRAMRDLLELSVGTHRVYALSASVDNFEQLGEFYRLLLATYQNLLLLQRSCVEAVMAITMEDLYDAQRSMRASMRRLEVLANAMSTEVQRADPSLMGVDQLNRRLVGFSGQTRNFEFAGQADIAAVLSVGTGDVLSDSIELGRRGVVYFQTLVTIDESLLAPEWSIALYALAAETAASDDPMTLRLRASVMLELYNDAFAVHPDAFKSSIVASEQQAEVAVGHLLSLGDRFTSRGDRALPQDALRQELATSYATLTEWVYRPLLNLPILAKRVLGGKSTNFSDISAEDFGAKAYELSQVADPRYAPALLGVSTVARNAGAHGTVDTSGPKITFTSRDRKGVTQIEQISDDEFVDRMQDLILTCRALLTAQMLFRVQHARLLPQPEPVFHRRVAVNVGKALLGRFGLTRVAKKNVDYDDVAFEAVEDNSWPGRDPRGYLVALFTLAGLFPNSRTVELVVFRGCQLKSRLKVATADVLEHNTIVEPLELLSLVRLCYLAVIEGENRADPSHIHSILIQPGSRLIVHEIQKLGNLQTAALAERKRYKEQLHRCIQQVEWFTSVLLAVPVEVASLGPVQGVLVGLSQLFRGLSANERAIQMGRWQDASLGDRQTMRGLHIMARWC